MTKRIRYQVACSLDGYIATPEGGYDWIVADPDIDFNALAAQFDTLLMGRMTFEAIGSSAPFPGLQIVVVSTTLRPEDHPGITIVARDVREHVHALREQSGKDIWLYGGGKLFRTLIELDLVDTVEPAIIPVLLGRGIPMYPGNDIRKALRLKTSRVYEKSGIVLLEYEVARPA